MERLFVCMLTALLAGLTVSIEEACTFPAEWRGSWFQSGVTQPVVINSSTISIQGQCVEQDGDKFLFRMIETSGFECNKCIAIYHKHYNVLQYKETYCMERRSLQRLCQEISGDALLLSMYRVDAQPVPCPFRGPFTFTYNRGRGDCRKPVSRVDSCTHDSRLLLRYQACPDIGGTESTVEELVCLATWKEGSVRYMVGKMDHILATSLEDRYRCFVYERFTKGDTQGWYVAQSGDATCMGVTSPVEGSRTMTLTKVSHHGRHCQFPQWLTTHHRWHTLDFTQTYQIHRRNTSLRITNTSTVSTDDDTKVMCWSVNEVSEASAKLVVHITSGCESGYVCLMFFRRDSHVVEVIKGSLVHAPEYACHEMHFDQSANLTTLVSATPHRRRCPYLGKYSVTGVRQGGRALRGICDDGYFSSLVVGCSSSDTMELRTNCPTSSEKLIAAYSCHGSWTDNDTHYLLASPVRRTSTGARRTCFVYEEWDGGLRFSSVHGTCHRRPDGRQAALAFNVTRSGQCSEAQTGGGPGVTVTTSLVLALCLMVSVLSQR